MAYIIKPYVINYELVNCWRDALYVLQNIEKQYFPRLLRLVIHIQTWSIWSYRLIDNVDLIDRNEMMVFYASFVHIVYAKLGQADDGDNEAKLMTKLSPEWVRTSDPVIRSPARYRWTTAPADLIERSAHLSDEHI